MFIIDWIEWAPTLIKGLGTSVLVTVLALILGFPLGALVGIGTTVQNGIIRGLCVVFVEVGRGIPALVLLYLVYYGLPQYGLSLTSFVAAVIGIALTAAAYSSELFRAGFDAVPKGETEAGRALGMRSHWILRDIVIPQGLRIASPSLIGLSVQMFQATALAYQIALPELLSQSYSIGTQTFKYLSALTCAGLLYLAVAVPIGQIAQRFSTTPGHRGRLKRRAARSSGSVPHTTTNPVIP